jgi:uncharacterized membrane-anchored protein
MADRRLRIALALAGTVLALAAVNASIAGKERLLDSGRVVYLELAPVDPRSLMQGDYMALNYRVANAITAVLPRREHQQPWLPELAPADGRVVVRVDDRSVATFVRLDDGRPLAGDEILLRYRVRDGRLKFASNAYFFQEGTAADYEAARYGRFRVAPDGELLLTALHGENLEPLGTAR